MASYGGVVYACEEFDKKATAWQNQGQSEQVYRLVAGQLHSDANCPPGPGICQQIIVQQGCFAREDFEANGWFTFDTFGLPVHSNQGETGALYGRTPVGDGIFPVHCCGSTPYKIGTVLGINVPDVEQTLGVGSRCRFLKAPEWDYPDPGRLHHQLCGNYDFSKIPIWSTYWWNQILAKALEVFGEVRPNQQFPDWWFRLFYGSAGKGISIQPSIKTSIPQWSNWDTKTGQGSLVWTCLAGTWPNLVFGQRVRNYHGRSLSMYPCMTVLGIHVAPNDPDGARYSYDEIGHDRKTGSFAFDNTTCKGEEGDPPKKEVPSCGPCLWLPEEGTPPTWDLPLQSGRFGYARPYPQDEGVGEGWDATHAINQMIENWHLGCIESAICLLVDALGIFVQEFHDWRSEYVAESQALIEAVEALQIQVDTKPLEDAMKAHTAAHYDIFTVTPAGG